MTQTGSDQHFYSFIVSNANCGVVVYNVIFAQGKTAPYAKLSRTIIDNQGKIHNETDIRGLPLNSIEYNSLLKSSPTQFTEVYIDGKDPTDQKNFPVMISCGSPKDAYIEAKNYATGNVEYAKYHLI